MEKPVLGWAFGRGQKQGAPQGREGEQKHARGGRVSPWRGNSGLRGSTTGFWVVLRYTFQNLPWTHASVATQTARGYGNFSGTRGKKKPITRSSSLFSHRLYLLINCLDLIHLIYKCAVTRSNNIKMHWHSSLCLHYFASVSSQFPNVILFKEVILRKMTFSAL